MPDVQTLHLVSGEGSTVVEKTYTVESFPAKERPLSAETLTKVFAKGGNEGIILAHLETIDRSWQMSSSLPASVPLMMTRPSYLELCNPKHFHIQHADIILFSCLG